MIQKFVDVWMAAAPGIKAGLTAKSAESYSDLFKIVVKTLYEGLTGYGDRPDPDRIVVVNHGDYQGTLLFVVAGHGYQPSSYWTCLVSYGSCSGCDSFEASRSWGDVLEDYTRDAWMVMMLHMVQSLKAAHE